MGCGSSKSVAVVDAMPGCSPSEETKHKEPISVKVKGPGEKKMTVANIITVKAVASCESIPTESQYGSSDSITAMSAKSASSSSNEFRNGSAKSTDSGLGKECGVIITENSSPPLRDVATVPENLPEPDLTIDGKQIETPGPIRHRKRTRSKGRLPPVHPTGRKWIQENSNSSASNTADKSLEAILQRRVQFADVLINELPLSSSIVKRPVSRGGVAFDIKDGEGTAAAKSHNRKPACVLKYAEHRRAVKVATHAELDEKQKAADKRRKEQEEMRMERIRAQQEKDRQVAEALTKFADMQSELKSELKGESSRASGTRKSTTVRSKRTSQNSRHSLLQTTGTG